MSDYYTTILQSVELAKAKMEMNNLKGPFKIYLHPDTLEKLKHLCTWYHKIPITAKNITMFGMEVILSENVPEGEFYLTKLGLMDDILEETILKKRK